MVGWVGEVESRWECWGIDLRLRSACWVVLVANMVIEWVGGEWVSGEWVSGE